MRRRYVILAMLVVVALSGTIACLRVHARHPATTATESVLDTVPQIGADETPALTLDAKLAAVGYPIIPSDVPHRLIERGAYVASYDSATRQPNWVMWRLTADRTKGEAHRPGNFHEDESVPVPRASLADYYGSGWSRGHMCPAGDCKWNQEAMNESFALTNVCPQDAGLNSGVWNQIEMKSRRWAERYGEVYVVTGPLFFNQEHTTIGANKIPVPEAFFKVILLLNNPPAVTAYVCRNEKATQKQSHYVNTLKQVERITGFHFFPRVEINRDSVPLIEPRK